MLGQLHELAGTNVAEAFAKYTGGWQVSFLKRKGLEEVIERLGEEIHNRYLIQLHSAALGYGGI